MMDGDSIGIWVGGEAVPAGSTKSFFIKKLNRVVTTHGNKKTMQWRESIRTELEKAIDEHPGWFTSNRSVGYKIEEEYVFIKPKSQPKKWKLMTKRPDLDKTQRNCHDAMSKLAFVDDSQIIDIHASKRYCDGDEPPGLTVIITKVISN